MAPRNLLNPLDPTFLFAISSTFSVLFVEGDEVAKQLHFRMPSMEEVISYFACPAFGICLAVLALALVGARKSKLQLSFGESLAANWYLWNTVVFHLLLDGFGGIMGILPLMHKNYRLLDRRYRFDLVGQAIPEAPLAAEVAVVTIINYMEIFVHAPLTLISFWGICYRSPWRQTVQAMALTVQLTGAVLFGMPDLLTGCENFQPIGKKDCTPPLDLFHFFYVYFGQAANYVWILIPALMLIKIVQSDIAEKQVKRD